MEIKIKIRELKKTFGDFIAVDGLTFDVYANEIFGLLGPNGAGKTTTINMICGLLPITSGNIVFDHRTSADKPFIGYCPQENIFYPKLTCLEQLVFIGQMYGLTAESAHQKSLELLNLIGLESKAQTRAGRLSGGMKRRLNLCLALVHDPEILILDEPEAGLDPQSRVLVRDFIQSIGKKKTIILTTHNMDEADRLADRVAIIDHGKLLLLDSPQNLKRTVGEGDVMELVTENSAENIRTAFTEHIATIAPDITMNENSIFIKHANMIEQLPAIKKMAEISGLVITEIKLRENSLEDVFIHLTGRNLRQ